MEAWTLFAAMIALALAWKIGLTVLIGLAGVVVLVFTAMFGGGTHSWMKPFAVTVIIILSIWIFGGCQHLSHDPQEREINREFMEHHMDAIVGGQH